MIRKKKPSTDQILRQLKSDFGMEAIKEALNHVGYVGSGGETKHRNDQIFMSQFRAEPPTHQYFADRTKLSKMRIGQIIKERAHSVRKYLEKNQC